ncbi:MAG: hypothetical protein K2G26_00200, partial [Clostridia bacterium]|nr:hypothetical protein [Clostridia bacterium]
SLTVGETKTLSAADGTTFTSEQPTVATVNSDGVISAKTKGVAKVKATNGNTVLTCTVIVLDKLSGSSQAVSKDPFTFNKTVDIGSVTSTTTPEESDPNAAEFKVEFSDGAITQNVANGCQVVEPLVENDGHYLTGWNSNGEAYDFSEPVTSNLVLTAQWASLPSGVTLLEGNSESIAVEFSGSAATSTVSYRLHGGSDSWHQIDSELIRAKNGGVRADIVGISAGVYDVKVNGTEITGGVPVAKYDRSGYAHFNRKSTDTAYTGVGAYKDDGTLKDNALVIYVTDENKNTVMEQVAATNSDVTMFDVPHYTGAKAGGKDWGANYKAKSIGWWLNNNQYTMDNENSSDNKRPSNTYDAVNGKNLGFRSLERPIVIRFIGTVNAPEGLTAYNCEDEGGSVKDNGRMARMRSLKNVTLEGIGDDAVIKGWGFHFIAGSGDATTGRGQSFEARNLTFDGYPEDALGMEGQQSGGKITGSVERCWIHHNTFLPGDGTAGGIQSPAENDKAEGDGSCDFKRGQYFTCSYNYYEYCHKTNLVGSSDSSLQYNMTYHHNIWYQCESRIPLIRQANVHFYNNYVFGDPTLKRGSLSYVHSLRANCYLFTEANYYEGCKNVAEKTGGAGKAYNNTYYACTNGGTGTLTVVDNREQTVANGCTYSGFDGKSLANFDTDPSLFYYDATNKKTDALLDDSVGARVRCVLYAGAQGHADEATAQLQKMNTNAASNKPTVPDKGKGKGQVITFSASANSVLTIDATSAVGVEVIRNDGKMVIPTFSGKKTVTLDAGIYMVCTGQKDKEATINSISLEEDSTAAQEARISEAKKAIEAIPNPVTRSSGSAIEKASQAYANLLTEAERTALGAELKERLSKAQTAYETVLVDYAIARIEYIGTVTEYSSADINAAVAAYKAVGTSAQSKVTNYAKLTAAQAKFSEFALTNLQNEINRLPLSSSLDIVDSRVAVELAISLYQEQLDEYSALEAEDKAKITVTNVNASLTVLKAKLAEIAAAEKEAANLAAFNELLEATTVENVTLTTGASLKAAYESLTAAQKDGVSADDKTKYEAIMAKYQELCDEAVTVVMSKNQSDYGPFTVKADSFKDISSDSKKVTINGTDYTTATEVNGNFELKFTIAEGTTKTLRIYVTSATAGAKIQLDGTEYSSKALTGDNYVNCAVYEITVEGTGKEMVLKKKSSNAVIVLIEMV